MLGAAALLLLLAACGGATATGTPPAGDDAPALLSLPTLEASALDGRPLRVLATTSLIGDAVARVGGDAIELTTLIGPGQDPHSYQPAAADLTAASSADVIFVNGWNLEEGLVDDLATIGEGAPLVEVSAGIIPLAYGEGHGHEEEHADEAGPEEDHDHGPADPHVWQSVPNVIQWVDNIRETLSALDPANAAAYKANAAAYRAELEALEAEIRNDLDSIPAERRVLVTNHDTFGYFAPAYGFEVLGTVLPSSSTIGEPTASGLVTLVQAMSGEGVCSFFVETTASDALAQALAAELDACEEVRILTLYTDALGAPGSGADSYPGMMRANAAALVEGLR